MATSRFKQFLIRIGMLFQDFNLEKEYKSCVMKNQRAYILFLNLVMVIMAFVLVYNVLIKKYPFVEIYPRAALAISGIFALIVYRFFSKYDELAMVFLFSFFYIYQYKTYEALYDVKSVLYASGNAVGIVEIIAIVVCRSNLSRFFLLLLSLILRIMFASIINSYLASLLSFVFWYMYESFNRKRFK